MLCNNGIESKDLWGEASRFFVKEKNKTEHMNQPKFYTDVKFALLIDLCSMAGPSGQAMHGSGTRLVNTTDGVQLEIEQNAKGSGFVNCHIFVTSDSQFNIVNKQLESAVLKMDPSNILFNALIVGPTNSGKTQFLMNQLCGPFCGRFDYVALICSTFSYNKTLKSVSPKISRIGRQKRNNGFFLFWPKEPFW